MKTRRVQKAEGMCLDRISRLPEAILETILCLLPIRVAARTSVLSKEWRYKWTKIHKLKLSHSNLCASVVVKALGRRCKSCQDIQQILLLRRAPIHELTIDMPDDEFLELDQIMLHLSKNPPVNNLTLNGSVDLVSSSKLPIPIYGFGSLGSLYLSYSRISTKNVLHFLSKCPSLKRLSLFIDNTFGKCTINQLFERLTSIEHLTTWSSVSKCFVLGLVPQKLPTSLIHLKYLCFQVVNIGDNRELAFVLLLIKFSPNLEKLKLEIEDVYNYEQGECVEWGKYSDVWLQHLDELEIQSFENSKVEMKFVKYILARSPKLNKVIILSVVEKKQLSKILKPILQAPRVSPTLLITVT